MTRVDWSREVRFYVKVDHETWREIMRGALDLRTAPGGTREQAAHVLTQWAQRRIRRRERKGVEWPES